MRTYCVVIWRIALLHFVSTHRQRAPHIVLIVADDLGWNDVSWNNDKMYTPNLEKLAREGVILEQHYVLPTCTPTRAALLTGRYPFRYGLQRNAIRHLEPDGLPVGLRTLAEELKDRNYSTHAFGKWHLGYCNWSLTPTHRGFDTFHGYYLGSQDYFTHMGKERRGEVKTTGYDYRNNEYVDWAAKGHYSTTLIARNVVRRIEQESKKSEPMFLYVAFQAVHAPLHELNLYQANCSNHTNQMRKKICEMAAAMDDAVGVIVQKLKDVEMWNNCLLVFMSDNGGQVRYGGSNWPLRGNKNTLYEGGTRVPAFVSGPLLNRTNDRSSSLIHVVDWFPTLLGATGVKNVLKDIDGVDQWPMIMDEACVAPRTQFIYNFDSRDGKLFGAIRDNYLKLILRPQKKFSGWYKEPVDEPENLTSVKDAQTMVLYNISADPYETTDLFGALQEESKRLFCELAERAPEMVPSRDLKDDPRGDPSLQEERGVYSPGWCTAPLWKMPERRINELKCC